jgi:hypothetical protein
LYNLGEAKPRLLHAQEQSSQRRVFGVHRTQLACGRALLAAPIGQIPSAILRGCWGSGLLNDEAFHAATPASPTNRDIVCERKDIIHQSQAADAADLALGTFEQNGDHMPALRPSNADKRFSLRQSQSNAPIRATMAATITSEGRELQSKQLRAAFLSIRRSCTDIRLGTESRASG